MSLEVTFKVFLCDLSVKDFIKSNGYVALVLNQTEPKKPKCFLIRLTKYTLTKKN